MRGRKKEQQRVQSTVDRWLPILGLGDWLVTHEFAVEHSDERSRQADTVADWRHREATFTWYLERTLPLKQDRLDVLVLHELVHCLLDPITPEEKASEDLLEYVTEYLARAILRAAA